MDEPMSLANVILNRLDRIQLRILRAAAENVTYKSWSLEYQQENLEREFSESKDQISIEELKLIPRSELYAYGFGNWDDKLLLIPLYLAKFINQDEQVESISGDKTRLGDADLDHRMGCIAWGFEHV